MQSGGDVVFVLIRSSPQTIRQVAKSRSRQLYQPKPRMGRAELPGASLSPLRSAAQTDLQCLPIDDEF